MHFVATLSHDPENCWVREEHAQEARNWVEGLDDRARAHGIDLHGAYVTPNEHTFYIVVEADDYEAVTEFLGPPFLEDHDGHVAPVLSLERSGTAIFED